MKFHGRAYVPWIGALFTVVLAFAWARTTQSVLFAAGVATYIAALSALRRTLLRRRFLTALALSLLGGLLILQGVTASRLARIENDWAIARARAHEARSNVIEQRIHTLTGAGVRVARSSAQALSSVGTDTTHAFRTLQQLQDSSIVDAIAVFARDGSLVAWAGDHHGQLPEPVRFGKGTLLFVEQPLYSYLYFVEPIPNSSNHVVAAILLSKAIRDNPSHASRSGIADHLLRINAAVRVGPGPSGSLNITSSKDTAAHIVLAVPRQDEVRAELLRRTRIQTSVAGFVILLLLFLAFVSQELPWSARRLGLATMPFVMAVAPINTEAWLFSPAFFLLPGPLDLTLGVVLSVVIAAAFLIGTATQMPKVPIRGEVPALAVGAVVVTLTYPITIAVLFGFGARFSSFSGFGTDALLLGGTALWFACQFVAFLFLSLITYVALPPGCAPKDAAHQKRRNVNWGCVAALLSAAMLSVLITTKAGSGGLPGWSATLWALPFVIAGVALHHVHQSTLMWRWLCAGTIAAGAVLPFTWSAYLRAQTRLGDSTLDSLGAQTDPFLEYMLGRFAAEAQKRSEAGDRGAQLLYRTWLATGMAALPYPARLTLWSSGAIPEVRLFLGGLEAAQMPRDFRVPGYLRDAFAQAAASSDRVAVVRGDESRAINAALVAGVHTEQVLTLEVPPRKSLETRGLPLIVPARTNATFRLELRPANGRQVPQRWHSDRAGLHKAAVVRYADGEYVANLHIRLPPFPVTVTRGILIAVLNLLLLGVIVVAGRYTMGGSAPLVGALRTWWGTVQGRLALALLLFFLIPTLAFGWLAYAALRRENVVTATKVAETAVLQVTREFEHARGNLFQLSERVASDVLYYSEGELARASSPDIREMGVYSSWVPPGIHFALRERGNATRLLVARSGDQQLVTAFRPIATGAVLAVPISAIASDAALRQREMSHLIAFGILVGAALSIVLAMFVSRALTRPITRLRRAAAVVGKGNFNVHLKPGRHAEFADLFAAFNLMILRLRRSRARGMQVARVLVWGEMARQVAHEIKNPLTPIKLSIQHVRRAYQDPRVDFSEVLDQNVSQILVEIDRLSEIATAFSRFGAPAESRPTAIVDVNAVVEEALLLYRAGDSRTNYEAILGPDVPPVVARKDEVMEVLFNLVENARAALSETGGSIRIYANRTSLEHVTLTVSDNGAGIPKEIVDRVFEPHFSTRTSGTGLGLAIVERLVRSWGGTIRMESAVGRGTSVTIMMKVASVEPHVTG